MLRLKLLIVTLSLSSQTFAARVVIDPGELRQAKVKYASVAPAGSYPAPAIAWSFSGQEHESLQRAIVEQVINEVVRRSDRPIAAFTVALGQEPSDIVLTVIWYDGSYTGWLVTRNADGTIPANAYENAFVEEDCGDSDE